VAAGCRFGALLIALTIPPAARAAQAPASSTAGAVIVGRVLDAASGHAVPATVMIRTADGTVLTDHPSFRDGFRSGGIFEKEVDPGPVTVTVSRGFDYLPQTREVDAAAGRRHELEFSLVRRSPLRRLGWVAGDNHVHMIHGERKITVDFARVALAARAEGLDYLSLAQHWNVEDPTPENLDRECAAVSTPDFRMSWNLEAPKNYWGGNVTHCAGHGWTLGMRGRTAGGRDVIAELLALSAWDYESFKPPVPNFEMHALIHSVGGISIYTHPHRWWWGKWGGQGAFPVEERKLVSNMAAELPFDTIAGPTYDAIDIMMQPRERDTNRQALELWFLLLNRGYRMAATASSDTTFDNPGSGAPGRVRLYTRVDGRPTFEAIARAMKQGRNFVTSGPLVRFRIGEHEVGDIVKAQPVTALPVRVETWGDGLTRVELIRNGEVIRSWAPDSSAAGEVSEAGTAWYVARVFGATPDEVAVTNPIYFEGPEYRAPQPEPARVEGTVKDAKTMAPVDAVIEVIEMDGRFPVRRSEARAAGGKFTLTVPATARLRARAEGYDPQVKSIFMDCEPLLNSMLEMTAERLSDWSTFENIRARLKEVKLDFTLQKSSRESR
jgi:hypothetical protein